MPANIDIQWHYFKNTVNGAEQNMNIQIFGTKKCNDTKKAERFFKGDRGSGAMAKMHRRDK